MANKNFIVKNGLDVGGLITGTTTTQSASDNTTKLASTAYVTTALANLADSAPSTLNTLNELAAALGDDANFSTTVTNSIATKLPLAGGTITGDLRLNTTLGIGVNASSAIGVYLTKSLANGLAAELSNTESSTGSGLVVKGGNNSSTYSADFRDYNNNSLMRIRGDGNVGIGTNSPLGLLSIKGTGDAIRVESTNTGAGGAQIDLLHYTTSPADNDIHGAINFGGYYSGSSSAYGSAIRSVWSDVSAKEAQLEFFTRDDSDFAVRMIVDKDGNVGIGGAPDSSGRLLVTNGGTNQIVLKGSAGTTNLNMGNFVGGGYISNNYYYSSGHQTDDNSKGAFEVFIGDSEYKVNYHAAGAAGTRRRDFAINSSGKVGIGTDSPTEKLTVAGAITTTGALSDDRTSTGSMDFVSGYTRFVAYGASGETGAFTFNTAQGGSSSSQKVVIDGLGRIGVGTIDPQTMIHIKTTSPGISFTDTNSFSDTNDRFQIRANSNNGQFQWYDDSTGTTHTHMTILEDGKVGIGTDSPLDLLHLESTSGDVRQLMNAPAGSDAEIKFAEGGTVAYTMGHDAASSEFRIGSDNVDTNVFLRGVSAGNVSIGRGGEEDGLAGLQVLRGGLLINGTAQGDLGVASTHYTNYWTWFGCSGRAGTYNGAVRINIPNASSGASGNAYGGFSMEIYIAGYNSKYCHAFLSGYTNNGITLSENAIRASSGGWSTSYGSVGSQGFYFDIDYPSGLIHPTIYIRVSKAGHTAPDRGTDFANASISWS